MMTKPLLWPLALWLACATVSTQTLDLRDRTGQATRDVYLIGAADVLNITVLDHPESSGKYTVQPDGTILVPVLGRIAVAGQTVTDFEAVLARTLDAEGVFRNTKVSITLETARGRKVFVLGGVSSQGTYVLADNDTLLQVLAKAGYGSASEVLVIRPRNPNSGPTSPDRTDDADILRVNLRDLEKDLQERGSLERNLVLRDNDTIFVPRVDPNRVFVAGMVHTPGAYSIAEGTTVIQALQLAGGATERAAMNRLEIQRLDTKTGKIVKIRVKLADLVRPGDTLYVPERWT